ncbi:MAG: hypothetical protein H6628_01370 [Calditrichae bacterium]|nr:hypothetical protein [Calditrichia bacterium]
MTRSDDGGGRSAGGCLGFLGGLINLAITDYFREMKGSLLYDHDTGIMSVIHNIEIGIVRGLDRNGIPAAKPANPSSQDSIIKPANDDPLMDPNLK